MDIVGPLPRSWSGSCYVLVMCDYATRYPEAVLLRNIDAGTVVEELVKRFARVGIPSELLTDQGANSSLSFSRSFTTFCMSMPFVPARTTPTRHDAEVRCTGRKRLGQDVTISPVRVPGGAPRVDEVFPF